MGITNIILLTAGVFVTLIGLAAFFNPTIARWINAPGTPIIKAIVAMIIGIILIIIGLITQLPG